MQNKHRAKSYWQGKYLVSIPKSINTSNTILPYLDLLILVRKILANTVKLETLTNLANQGKIAKLKPFKVKPPSKISTFKRCNSTTFASNSSTVLSSKFNESGFIKV